MRTRLVALALGLLAVPGMGWSQGFIHYTPPHPWTCAGTTCTLSGVLLLQDGSATAPSLAYASATQTGFYRYDATSIGWATGGTLRGYIGVSTIYVASTAAAFVLSDTYIRREAANTLQIGDDAATAAAQTIVAADSSGAGNTGASLTLSGGSGGSGGAQGAVIISGPSLQSSGNSKAVVDNTATAFARIAVADDHYSGLCFTWTAYAEDADTDARQTRSGHTCVAILNNSGTEAAVFSTGDEAVGVTAGTFTCTFDGNSAVNNTIDLRATCNTSLDAAAETLTFEYRLDVPSATTVTAQ